MLAKIGLLILFLGCRGVTAAELSCAVSDDADNDIEAPALKRSKFDEGALPLGGKKKKTIADEILNKLQEFKEMKIKCHYTRLIPCIRTELVSPVAVLEGVVDMMFRKKIDVIYDDDEFYWLLGAVEKPDPPRNMAFALARVVSTLPDDSTVCLAKLGYCLFKKGYFVDEFRTFEKIYKSVCVLCNVSLTQTVVKQAKNFIDFIKEELQGEKQDFAEMCTVYANEQKRALPAMVRSVAFYIFSLENVERISIENIGRKAAGLPMISVQKSYKTDFFCSELKEVFSLEENNFCDEAFEDHYPCGEFPEGKDLDCRYFLTLDQESGGLLDCHHCMVDPNDYFADRMRTFGSASLPDLAIAVSEALFVKRQEDLDEILQTVQSKGYQVLRDDLCHVVNAVRVLCCDKGFSGIADVWEFVVFVREEVWGKNNSFEDKLNVYCHNNSCEFSREWQNAARYILMMKPEALSFVRNKKRPHDRIVLRPPSDYRAVLADFLHVCAQNKMEVNIDQVEVFFQKRKTVQIEVVRQVFGLLFQERLSADYINKTFYFSHCLEEKPMAYVPIEVLVAARFDGSTCSAKDRTCFANMLYKAGYSFLSFKDYANMFDAVCVMRNISPQGVISGARCREFWRYIQLCPKEKTLKNYLQGYYKKSEIGGQEWDIMEIVFDLARRDVFALWMQGSIPQGGITYARQKANREKLLLRVLQEYAKHKEGCSYRVLDTFLTYSGDEKRVLSCVLDWAFRESVNFCYDRHSKKYKLLYGAKGWRNHKIPPNVFVAQNLRENILKDCVFIACDLYDAGYHMQSYQRVEDLYCVYHFVLSGEIKSVSSQCRACLMYAIPKMWNASDSDKISRLLRYFHCRNESLYLREQAFVKSLGRVCQRRDCFVKEVDALLCFSSGVGDVVEKEWVEMAQKIQK